MDSSFCVVEHSWHPFENEPRPSELMLLGVTQVSVDNRTLGHLISKTQLSELTCPCQPRTELPALKFHPLLLATWGLFEMFLGQKPIMLKMTPLVWSLGPGVQGLSEKSGCPQRLLLFCNSEGPLWGWPTPLGTTLKAIAGAAEVCGQWSSEAACRTRGPVRLPADHVERQAGFPHPS